KPLSPGPGNSPQHLLQDARCAWSAQHIAVHHSSPEEKVVLGVLLEDPVALSECYYMCARERLEELVDVPDIRTTEALMILSNVQGHWDPRQSSRYLGLLTFP